MADPTVLAAKVQGPLGPYALGFHDELRSRGSTPLSAMAKLRWMAHLSRWMNEAHIGAAELSLEVSVRFCDARRSQGWRSWLKPGEVMPLLDYLRVMRVVPEPIVREPATAEERLLAIYRDYLVKERGLTPAVVSQWERIASLFIAKHPDVCEVHSVVRVRDVVEFVTAEVPRRGKKVASGLRTFLRFLHLDGRIPLPLAQAVPTVAGWSGASLPRWVDPAVVERLLGSCDLTSGIGRRDRAILLLLVRVGLRAGEVAGLEVDDFDWHAGEMVVRGKGRTVDRLPLTAELGEAIAAYLRSGRTPSGSRALFLRALAPIGPLSRHGIRDVVYEACDRIGVPRVGPHRLRHSAATAMLRAGASLPEVGQVLRHRSLNSTAIYAKVDHVALRELALPWPEGVA
jgi:integrase/recombinase XerD